jgi:hypothetical protein
MKYTAFLLTLLLTGCETLTPAQNALIERVATAATDRLIQEIGPRPVRPQK